MENKFDFREKYFSEFVNEFENSNNFFKVIKTRRGEANNHKFILLFDNRIIAEKFINYLFLNRIYCLSGYKLLKKDLTYLPNCKKYMVK